MFAQLTKSKPKYTYKVLYTWPGNAHNRRGYGMANNTIELDALPTFEEWLQSMTDDDCELVSVTFDTRDDNHVTIWRKELTEIQKTINNFTWATQQLIKGHDIRRAEWPKNNRIYKIDNIIINFADGKILPSWIPTFGDIIAIDWEIYERVDSMADEEVEES